MPMLPRVALTVWKSSSPVYSSMRMQPALHTSEGVLHPRPRMTSGARYWRVLMRELLCSQSKVAPPKSISFRAVEAGASTRSPVRRTLVGLLVGAKGSLLTSSTFSSFRSVWMRRMPCRKATACSSWSAKACTQYSGGGLYSFVFT